MEDHALHNAWPAARVALTWRWPLLILLFRPPREAWRRTIGWRKGSLIGHSYIAITLSIPSVFVAGAYHVVAVHRIDRKRRDLDANCRHPASPGAACAGRHRAFSGATGGSARRFAWPPGRWIEHLLPRGSRRV